MKPAVLIDLLQTDVYAEYATRPSLLRERIQDTKGLIVIDEVQKVPRLLDEVHWLIENRGLQFLLTGSSARKLRRGHANLLGGRAWKRHMTPLSLIETEGFDLESVMTSGLLPPHFLSGDPVEDLRAYVADYLARRQPKIGSPEFGKSFEHYILMEIKAYQAYRKPDLPIAFWRTSHGQEVDFILGDGEAAVEIKGSGRVHEGDLRSLSVLREECSVKKRLLVSLEKEPRLVQGVQILPWKEFVGRLWDDDLV